MNERLFETDYGYFTDDGWAYVIKRPDTPRPWVNVLANKNYGAIVSQAGGGFSWLDHSALSVLTRWEMDLVRDDWGKHVYGPESDRFGEGGWSWYTGSAAWLRRICQEWILGVRPEREGLVIDPCLPEEWDGAKLTRPFRGDVFEIEFIKCAEAGGLEVDGQAVDPARPIAASGESRARRVTVRYANAGGARHPGE